MIGERYERSFVNPACRSKALSPILSESHLRLPQQRRKQGLFLKVQLPSVVIIASSAHIPNASVVVGEACQFQARRFRTDLMNLEAMSMARPASSCIIGVGRQSTGQGIGECIGLTARSLECASLLALSAGGASSAGSERWQATALQNVLNALAGSWNECRPGLRRRCPCDVEAGVREGARELPDARVPPRKSSSSRSRLV